MDEVAEDEDASQLRSELKSIQAALAALPPQHACRQSLEEAAIYSQKPLGVRIDGLRGVLDRTQSRLTKAKEDLVDAQNRVQIESAAAQMYSQQLADIESSIQHHTIYPLGSRPLQAEGPPDWMCVSLQHIAQQLRTDTPFQRAELATHLEKLLEAAVVPAPSEHIPVGADTDMDSPCSLKEKVPPVNDTDPLITQEGARRRLTGKTFVETPQLGLPGSAPTLQNLQA